MLFLLYFCTERDSISLVSSTLFPSQDCWDTGHMTLRCSLQQRLGHGHLIIPSVRVTSWPTATPSTLVPGSFQALEPTGNTWLKTMPLPPKQPGCMKTVYWKQSLDHWTPKLRTVLESTGWTGQVHAQDSCVHVLVFGNVLKLSPLLAATLLLKWLALAV